MEFYITGDLHGKFDRIEKFHRRIKFDDRKNPEEIGIICLGDVGVNYYLNRTDRKNKEKLCNLGFTYYLVRGNHELPPSRLPNICIKRDNVIDGDVYVEKEYPNIKYLIDGEKYLFNAFSAIAIGGAYSVDKYYRLGLAKVPLEASYDEKAAAGWFEDEQLAEDVKEAIFDKYAGTSVSMILSHTCPISLEPTDLFLNGVDQSTVDKSMENFLELIKESVHYRYWFFGHYHEDRIEAPYIEMFYRDIVALDTIIDYWREYTFTGELPWWLNLSPNFNKRQSK